MLEKIRKGKKITQKELAEKVGISESTYKKNIVKENMTIAVLEKICLVLQISICELFETGTGNDESILREPEIEYGKMTMEFVEDLRKQITIKDEQISFLQHLIEKRQKIND